MFVGLVVCWLEQCWACVVPLSDRVSFPFFAVVVCLLACIFGLGGCSPGQIFHKIRTRIV